MNKLIGGIINETEKLFLRKKMTVFLILAAVIPIASAFIVNVFQRGSGIAAIGGSGLTVMMLNLFTGILLPLFIFVAAADGFTGEIGDRTLKLTLSRPISRFKVYVSKTLSVWIYTALSLIVIFAFSTLSSFIMKDMGAGVFQNLKLCFAAFFPLAEIALMATFICQLFKGSSGALATMIITFIGFSVLGLIMPDISRFFPTAYMNWHIMWLGNLGFGRIVNIFMFLLSYSIIFFAAGFYLFDKRNI